MTTRRALIIGAPDEKIPGVNVDVKNLLAYLKSPIGGFWYDSEIKSLVSSSASTVRNEISLLKQKDYSLIFFAGHGYHSEPRNRTIVHLNSRETMDSVELRSGATKHTLILDCCRKREDDRRLLKAAMEAMTFDSANRQKPDSAQCRLYFDKTIEQCDIGIVVMNSCAINETAGESEKEGGYYTSSLIDSANEWAETKLRSMDLTKQYARFSTQECHAKALENVRALSGGRQNPLFESPRTENKFPFAVVA